ncbi:hypothetical protein BST61_g10643 [Cercospora zeina]
MWPECHFPTALTWKVHHSIMSSQHHTQTRTFPELRASTNTDLDPVSILSHLAQQLPLNDRHIDSRFQPRSTIKGHRFNSPTPVESQLRSRLSSST